YLTKSLGRPGSLWAFASLQSIRSNKMNLFHFNDTMKMLGINASLSWSRLWQGNLSTNVKYRFSRLRNQVSPFFANRVNISGNAGMTGNLQDPLAWGPPTLVFSSGIASLTDAQSASNRNRTDTLSGMVSRSTGRHGIVAGGDVQRIELN